MPTMLNSVPGGPIARLLEDGGQVHIAAFFISEESPSMAMDSFGFRHEIFVTFLYLERSRI
jgi:hypothetical protein